MIKILNHLLFVLYLLLIFLTPLIMFHKTSELFEFNKMIFIYSITIIILSVWIGKMVIYKKIIIKKTLFDIPIFLFLTSQFLSTFFSIDRHTSIFGYYGRFNGGLLSIISYVILYYGFVSNINGETSHRDISRDHQEGSIILRDISTLLKTSLISSTIVILWGLPGKFGYDLTCYLFTGVLNNNCWTEQFKPAERMFSTLGQPNWLGAYLAINFFISLYFLFKDFEKKSLISQFLNFSISFLIFSAILFTRSRSSLLAVFFAFILFFLLDLFVLSKKIQVKKYLWLGLLLFIPLILFKTGVSQIDQFLSNPIRLIHPISSNFPASSPTSTTGITESGDIRKIVWEGAINLGLKYPFFGTGVETFAYSYYFFRPKKHNLTSEWDFIYNKAHNEYLNYLATTGFFGLGTYLLIIGAVFIFFLKKITNYQLPITKQIPNPKSQANFSLPITNNQLLITSLFLSYFSILITNFFGFSTTTTNLYFYLLPAFLFSLSNSQPTSNFQFSTSNALTLWQKIFIFFLSLIIPLGLIFPISYFLADTNYALADNYQKLQQYPQAYFYLTKALSYKYEHVYEDKLSGVLANLAYLYHLEKEKQSQTRQSINQLIKLSDFYNLKSIKASSKNVLYWKTRAKIYYIFSQIQPNNDYLQEAIKALEKAKSLSPTDPKLYYTQAMIFLEKEEEKNKALAVIEKAIELKPDYRDGYFAKGLILKNLGKKEEAKKVFEYILKYLNPNDEETQKEINTL